MNTDTVSTVDAPSPITEEERLRRWRLVLGGQAEGSCGKLSGQMAEIDQALAALYDADDKGGLGKSTERKGGRGSSAPSVARWLGDIRKYFPTQVVQVMQRDALERLDLRSLLLEPEMLESAHADVHLVANLIALSGVIPASTKETARMVVRKVVNELLKKLEEPMRSAVTGALDRSQRNRRPRHSEIDWNRTIRANLRHWQEEYRTIVPQQLIGYGRKARSPQREVVLCIDQSGSMAASVVYSSIFGAVMASLPAVATKMVVFDTAIVDLTDQLDDPVELLFGVQLGGGTDIAQAVRYCSQLIENPHRTVLVLISDFCEGGSPGELVRCVRKLAEARVRLLGLAALDGEAYPFYDRQMAERLAASGMEIAALTPQKLAEWLVKVVS